MIRFRFGPSSGPPAAVSGGGADIIRLPDRRALRADRLCLPGKRGGAAILRFVPAPGRGGRPVPAPGPAPVPSFWDRLHALVDRLEDRARIAAANRRDRALGRARARGSDIRPPALLLPALR